MDFEKGQKVWETACYAKPVICRCCGIQKYLSIKPRVQQVEVTNEGFSQTHIEISPGKNPNGWKTFTVVPAERLFVKRADAMKAAKKQAAKDTQDNRLKYMLYRSAQKGKR